MPLIVCPDCKIQFEDDTDDADMIKDKDINCCWDCYKKHKETIRPKTPDDPT